MTQPSKRNGIILAIIASIFAPVGIISTNMILASNPHSMLAYLTITMVTISAGCILLLFKNFDIYFPEKPKVNNA